MEPSQESEKTNYSETVAFSSVQNCKTVQETSVQNSLTSQAQKNNFIAEAYRESIWDSLLLKLLLENPLS